jgi:3-oxoacyl-[acyl-carrier-protein] synthase-3
VFSVLRQSDKSISPRFTAVGVLSTGHALGSILVHNEQFSGAIDSDPEWVYQRTGIRQRYLAPPETTTSDLACQAATQCLQQADVDPAEIDLLLVTTLSPDHLVPAVANVVQDHLGLSAGAMDLHASCAGFVYGLVTASQFIATGSCRSALVIGADTSSRFADPADRKLSPLFGDGAGAVLLGPGQGEQGMLAFDLGSDGSRRKMLQVPVSAEPRLVMDGRGVFKWAVTKLCQSVAEVLARADRNIKDVDHFVFHQANLRMLDSIARNLDVDMSKVVTNIQQVGNTANASIPLALHEAMQAGKIQAGDTVLIGGFGGGLSWGTCLLQW